MPQTYEVVIKDKEFSISLVQGIYYSFLVKRKYGEKVKIRLFANDYFHPLLAKQFCDELIVFDSKLSMIPSSFPCYPHVRETRFDTPEFVQQTTMQWRFPKRKRRIVSFVPVLSERWRKDGGWLTNKTSFGRSLPFECWMELRKIAQSFGYKVFVFASNEKETGLQWINNWRELGDQVFVRNQSKVPNKFLMQQLEHMYHSRTSVALGGAAYLAPIFGLPQVGSDPHFYNKDCGFNSWSKLAEGKDILTVQPKSHDEVFSFMKERLVKQLQGPVAK